jgi:CRISPR-associated protein (TIGR03986 family)
VPGISEVIDGDVVVLSWDPGDRRLGYVPVRSGKGGMIVSREVPAEFVDSLSAELSGLSLPRTAYLVVSGGEIQIDASGGYGVVLCSVEMSGSPADRHFKLRPGGSRAVVATPAAASLGIENPDFAAAARNLSYLYAEPLTPPGCWLCDTDDGIDAWLARQQEKRTEKEHETATKIARRLAAEKADTSFVNPYTFVPFPGEISRDEPAGHARMGKRNLSGTFTVVWEFTSPFQAPEGASGTSVLTLPGSSVKGAVRSVHESLAGGCLRVFDDEFIPSYRDTPSVRPDTWKLAVVGETTRDGQPLVVQLCDDVVWVPLAKLRAACGGSLMTGSRVTLGEGGNPPTVTRLDRKELADTAAVTRGGGWVVLVTEPGTRSKKTGAYFLACGRLGLRTAEVTESAWRAFRLAVAGTDDKSPARRTDAKINVQEPRPFRPVTFDHQPVGRRRVVTGLLWPEDVIWVNTADAGGMIAVTGLSLAAVWRHPGWEADPARRGNPEKWAAGGRVPGHMRACDDPESLCLSCRIFGSTDAQARGGANRSEQRSYAGHVRFGDACSGQPVVLEKVKRAPMGAPRPGAGQFYLAYDDVSPAKDRTEKPTREWGSKPDSDERRQLRGRKFYWHADPARQSPPRHIARDHQAAERESKKKPRLIAERWIAAPGTRLCQRISFDNLTEADLGGLLAALEPQRVIPASSGGAPRLHLGGGKPLGMGSCSASITGLRVWTAESRYGSAPDIAPSQDSYVASFAGECLPGVTATWPALAAVLAESTVDAERVWYPPGARWSDRLEKAKAFDEPWHFFKASSGMALHDKESEPRRLIPLPEPDAPDQSLGIVTKDDLK